MLKSTTKDLILYAKANLYPPENTLGKAIKLTHQKIFSDGDEVGGLGWAILIPRENSGKRLLGHSGGTGGFESWLFINEENNSALVVLFNAKNDKSQRSEFLLSLCKIITE